MSVDKTEKKEAAKKTASKTRTTSKSATVKTSKAASAKAPGTGSKASKASKKVSGSETVFISNDDMHLFGNGSHYYIYKKLGSHPSTGPNGESGYYFAVWAPHARAVHVVGDFNNWEVQASPMEKLGDGGIYGLFIPGVESGQNYKYLITAADGREIYKADPFANYSELRPGNASRTFDIGGFKWNDASWFEKRNATPISTQPIMIYECHIGSWMKHPDGGDGFYTYREFADRIIPYLRDMQYTHVELMGISEHPFDGSWGYQVTGYYAPTSRYGTPEDFMYLINSLHRNGIGVIMDWVPAHFATDDFALANYDGEPLFEHPDTRLGEHPDWGTKIFNYQKTEVRNFLIANVLYWMREFHVDGIRVDAVASMLYLDYGRQEGQWVPNKYGGNQNLDAIEFFKHLNSIIHGADPHFLMIAEESTAWPKITETVENDGLGFTYKWNMGWMHDFCEYMKLDPYFRKNAHNSLTFAMSYNDAEYYILPLSHDEVVHLKCSMLGKMPGYEIDKYANLRLAYTFFMGHAGKKLLFMGQEFAQEREWSEERELDWFLLENPLNRGMQDYMRELITIYRKNPCMYTDDKGWNGFQWLNADDADRSVYSFYRVGDAGKNIMFVLNMTPMKWENYQVGVPKNKTYKLLLNSDDARFGGNGNVIPGSLKASKVPCGTQPFSITLDLPPFTALVFKF